VSRNVHFIETKDAKPCPLYLDDHTPSENLVDEEDQHPSAPVHQQEPHTETPTPDPSAAPPTSDPPATPTIDLLTSPRQSQHVADTLSRLDCKDPMGQGKEGSPREHGTPSGHEGLQNGLRAASVLTTGGDDSVKRVPVQTGAANVLTTGKDETAQRASGTSRSCKSAHHRGGQLFSDILLSAAEDDPKTYKQAMHCTDADAWDCGYDEEMASLKKHNVWTLVPCLSIPASRKIVGSQPYFLRKHNEKGENSQEQSPSSSEGILTSQRC